MQQSDVTISYCAQTVAGSDGVSITIDSTLDMTGSADLHWLQMLMLKACW